MSSGKANVSPASPKPTLIGFDVCDIDGEIKKIETNNKNIFFIKLNLVK
jgi:hypothetical protein